MPRPKVRVGEVWEMHGTGVFSNEGKVITADKPVFVVLSSSKLPDGGVEHRVILLEHAMTLHATETTRTPWRQGTYMRRLS